MVLNQIIRSIPDLRDRIADTTGQAPESLDIYALNIDTIPAAAIGVVWHAVSSVIDWRILLALSTAALLVYYYYSLTDDEPLTLEDADMFTDEEIKGFTYEISRKLLE
jgi:hypothetical protein